jgi:MaoC like domain
MGIAPKRQEAGREEEALDEALTQTFPASDPVAIGHSARAGTPERHAASLSPARGFTATRPLPQGERHAPAVEWFDDLAVGMRFRSAEKRVTAEDIKRFAAEFDPQPYHLDEEAAKSTALKGLAA